MSVGFQALMADPPELHTATGNAWEPRFLLVPEEFHGDIHDLYFIPEDAAFLDMGYSDEYLGHMVLMYPQSTEIDEDSEAFCQPMLADLNWLIADEPGYPCSPLFREPTDSLDQVECPVPGLSAVEWIFPGYGV